MTARRALLRVVGFGVVVSMAFGIALAAVTRPALAQVAAKPRIAPARVAGELVAGAYSGIAGFLIGRFVAEGVTDLAGVENETTQRRLGLVGGVIGGSLATAGVVYAIGNAGDQMGDFDATYLGTGIGFVAALGIAKMVLGPGGPPREGMSTRMRWTAVNVLALLPAIGATIAFNSTRRTQ